MDEKTPSKSIVTARPLTHKQRLFVEAFIGEARGNATQAARLAGYKGTDNTLNQVGLENIRKPNIAALCKQRIDEAVMTADEVLAELASIARANHLEVTVQGKLKALELVGRYHALFTDKTEISGGLAIENVIRPKLNDGNDDNK